MRERGGHLADRAQALVPLQELPHEVRFSEIGDEHDVPGLRAERALRDAHLAAALQRHFAAEAARAAKRACADLGPSRLLQRHAEDVERRGIEFTHQARTVDELAYHDLLVEHLPKHEILGELIAERLLYYPTVTREQYRNMGRVTELINNGRLFEDLGLSQLDPASDRVMICGSPGMLKDLKHMLEGRGFKEGSTTTPGDYVIERAFVEK